MEKGSLYRGGKEARRSAPSIRGHGQTVVSLKDRGFTVICRAVVIIRTDDGFLVGIQEKFRSGGEGRLWKTIEAARKRAKLLADKYGMPRVESI